MRLLRDRFGFARVGAAAFPVTAALGLLGGCATFGGGEQDFDVLDDDNANATYRNMTVDQIEDVRIVRNGRVVGEVEAVLGDRDGTIAAVVAELNPGQPSSTGGTEVVVPIESLEFGQAGFAQLDLDDVELAALRRWEE